MASSNEWSHLSAPDPEFKAFYDTIGLIPPMNESIPISTLREMASSMTQFVPGVNIPVSMDGVVKTRIMVPVRDGKHIGAVLYQPDVTPEKGSPLMLAFHGGGWCTGTPEWEETTCVNAVQRYGAVALSIDYRLAPEHPFPTGVNDAWDALKWAASNASHLRAAPSQGFIIHGESAGGNFATVLALLARDERLDPPLTGVLASIPIVLSPEAVPDAVKAEYQSRHQNGDAPGFNAKLINYVTDLYAPDVHSGFFNPFNWPTGHQGLPPTLFQICGMDPLRDEDLLYERLLRESGVSTKVIMYPGFPHSFWGFFPQLPASKRAVEGTAQGIKWLLDQPANGSWTGTVYPA